MLKSKLAVRIVSTSQRELFHTSIQCSVPSQKTKQSKKASEKERRNLIVERRRLQKQHLEITKPDAVLGHRNTAEGYQLWKESELAQLLLNKDKIWGVKVDEGGNVTSTEDRPKLLNFGLEGDEARKLLFDDLPAVMIDKEMYGSQTRTAKNALDAENLANVFQEKQEREAMKVEHLARILDMRNASSKDIHKENVRRIVEHFGGKTLDSGLSEVQAAVLTYRIRLLEHHLRQFRKDVWTHNALIKLVSKRSKILRYLKRSAPERYHAVLPKIAMEKRAVEEQIHVGGMQTLIQLAERTKFPVF